LPMVISFVLSDRAVTLLPAYMKGLLPTSVVARPMAGKPPTIPLALAYSESNTSALLHQLLFQAADFIPSSL
jgi:LysR family hca operon transcriptional activator